MSRRTACSILLFLSLAGCGRAVAAGWSSLWNTDDQRGEALLRSGDAAGAAKTYADPRRKAYAELKAGDFDGAAKDYEAFHDTDAEYNRGNALAGKGDLDQAVKAYDAAIAIDPQNRDAAHNREIVQKALHDQQQKQDEQSGKKDSKETGANDWSSSKSGGSPSKGSDGKPSQEGTGDDGSNGKPDAHQEGKTGSSANDGNAPPHGGSKPPNRDGTKPAAAPQSGQASSKDDSADDQRSRASGPSPDTSPSPRDSVAKGQNDEASGSGDRAATPPAATPGTPANEADEKAAAQRDAESALAAGASAKDRNSVTPKRGASLQQGVPTAPSAPPSEAQLAREQWLRRIPDDPGGLLRRKFEIEHRLRQREQSLPQPETPEASPQ